MMKITRTDVIRQSFPRVKMWHMKELMTKVILISLTLYMVIYLLEDDDFEEPSLSRKYDDYLNKINSKRGDEAEKKLAAVLKKEEGREKEEDEKMLEVLDGQQSAQFRGAPSEIIDTIMAQVPGGRDGVLKGFPTSIKVLRALLDKYRAEFAGKFPQLSPGQLAKEFAKHMYDGQKMIGVLPDIGPMETFYNEKFARSNPSVWAKEKIDALKSALAPELLSKLKTFENEEPQSQGNPPRLQIGNDADQNGHLDGQGAAGGVGQIDPKALIQRLLGGDVQSNSDSSRQLLLQALQNKNYIAPQGGNREVENGETLLMAHYKMAQSGQLGLDALIKTLSESINYRKDDVSFQTKVREYIQKTRYERAMERAKANPELYKRIQKAQALANGPFGDGYNQVDPGQQGNFYARNEPPHGAVEGHEAAVNQPRETVNGDHVEGREINPQDGALVHDDDAFQPRDQYPNGNNFVQNAVRIQDNGILRGGIPQVNYPRDGAVRQKQNNVVAAIADYHERQQIVGDGELAGAHPGVPESHYGDGRVNANNVQHHYGQILHQNDAQPYKGVNENLNVEQQDVIEVIGDQNVRQPHDEGVEDHNRGQPYYGKTENQNGGPPNIERIEDRNVGQPHDEAIEKHENTDQNGGQRYYGGNENQNGKQRYDKSQNGAQPVDENQDGELPYDGGPDGVKRYDEHQNGGQLHNKNQDDGQQYYENQNGGHDPGQPYYGETQNQNGGQPNFEQNDDQNAGQPHDGAIENHDGELHYYAENEDQNGERRYYGENENQNDRQRFAEFQNGAQPYDENQNGALPHHERPSSVKPYGDQNGGQLDNDNQDDGQLYHENQNGGRPYDEEQNGGQPYDENQNGEPIDGNENEGHPQNSPDFDEFQQIPNDGDEGKVKYPRNDDAPRPPQDSHLIESLGDAQLKMGQDSALQNGAQTSEKHAGAEKEEFYDKGGA